MRDVILYVVAVLVAFWLVFAAVEVSLAVMYARGFYRRHPELEPPDRFLVRVGLRGVR